MSKKVEGLNIESWKKSTSVGMSWELVDFPKQQVEFIVLDGKKDPSMQFLKMNIETQEGTKRTIALKYIQEFFDKGILKNTNKGIEYTGKELSVVNGKFIFA